MGITAREKASYMAAALFKDIAFVYIMMYFAFLYEISLAASSVLLFLILFIAKFVDGLSDFAIGLLIDKTNSRYGKFKPYIMLGTVLFPLAVIIHMTLIPYVGNMFVNTLFYIILCILYSIADVAFWSMIPSFGSQTNARETMSVLGRVGAFIGYEGAILVILYSTYQFEREMIFNAYLVVACLVLFVVSQGVLLQTIRDRSLGYNQTYRLSANTLVKVFFANDQLHIVSLIIFLVQIALYVSLFSVSIYINDSKQSDYYFLTSAVASTVGGLLAFAIYPSLRSHLPRKLIFMGACSAFGLGLLLIIASVMVDSMINFHAGIFLIFSGLAWLLICNLVMLANTVDYGEFRANFRIEGLTMSMVTLSTKLAVSLGMLFCYFVLNYELEQGSSMLVIISVNLVVGLACIALIMFIYLSLYKLNGSFYIHMLNTLDRLRDIDNKNELNYTSVRYALDERSILMHLEDDKFNTILDKLFDSIVETNAISDPNVFKQDLLNKLRINPCGIAEGIAIAHAKSKGVQRPALAVATLNHAIDCGAIDGKDCDLIFLIASPQDANAHLNLLGKLSLILNESNICDELRMASSQAEIIERIFTCEKFLMLRNN